VGLVSGPDVAGAGELGVVAGPVARAPGAAVDPGRRVVGARAVEGEADGRRPRRRQGGGGRGRRARHARAPAEVERARRRRHRRPRGVPAGLVDDAVGGDRGLDRVRGDVADGVRAHERRELPGEPVAGRLGRVGLDEALADEAHGVHARHVLEAGRAQARPGVLVDRPGPGPGGDGLGVGAHGQATAPRGRRPAGRQGRAASGSTRAKGTASGSRAAKPSRAVSARAASVRARASAAAGAETT